jgi:glycerol-3-phosphate acyltransferase PlsX
VFLGLNGTVVKSHGSADATGIAAAIKLAFQLASTDFSQKLAIRMAASLPEQSSSDSKEVENNS